MVALDVPFTSFQPDLPALGNPGLVRAHNCSPGLGAGPGAVTFFPLKRASLYSDTTMASMPLGSAVGQDRFQNAKVYGADAGHLYKLSPSTRDWTDISRTGGYLTSATEGWKSVEFGSLQCFTNYSDNPQFIDMNTDVKFADLTTLVKGRHINTHKGFVILGNTYDALDGAVPYRLRWSGLESPSDWTFSAATMSDFQDIQGFGSIQGIVTDDSCYVLLQRGIVQATFVGSPYIFQFESRVTGKGCSVSQSVITVEGKHFFLSDDGFYMLQGGQLQPIGMGKIDKWFLENADLTQANLMTVAADPRETLVYWQFCSKNAVAGKPDMMLIYNYHTGEWTTADATSHFIFNSMSLPWTIDQLDEFGSLDNVPASFDDPVWSGGKNLLWGMDQTGKIYSFSGSKLELSIETPEFQLSRMLPNDSQADMATVHGARPLFEGDGTARISVGTKSLQNTDVVWSELKETNAETGFAYFRNQSRYQRIRLTISGDWNRAFSLQIDGKTAGRR
ncbi:hypothetical protein [Rhizobium sp. Root482]|uniref:hypothetical protein n=1 Tax=Rhizobium sp. Root482 TaxID=1736543 RepID=UPI0006F23F88|nr:hypothetical protein [Rhizobium sp. Root482]KQY14428.1 hypothetical protein ASD31_09170 [Rhizobium sp. Root482]